MPTVQERYRTATAYVRRAVTTVENRGIAYAVDPVTGLIEWYAGRTKTEPARNELARLDERWLRASSDIERARLAREAELLADRVQETLPGAPQDRERTNLFKGEEPTSTPATSYYGEVAAQADTTWHWLRDKAGYVADEATTLGKLLLVGGGVVAAWKLVDYLRLREQRRHVRSAGSTEHRLNANLARVAQRRDGRPRSRRVKRHRVRLDDTELHTWFERDRAHVELSDCRSGETIVEWWDDDVQQAIDDGFLLHRWTGAKAHAAAFDYAKSVGLVDEPRDAGARPSTYSLRLTRAEIEALHWLAGRYTSAQALVDGLMPLDESAEHALAREFDRREGPYRFQIRAADVRKVLRATAGDGGNYGAIPNLRSDAVNWVLAQERGR